MDDDILGLSINKVSDLRLTARNITDYSTLTKLVNYWDLDHCEGVANNEVVDCFECSSANSSTEEEIIAVCLQQQGRQQRACDVAQQFSVIANDWKEDNITLSTPELSGLPEINWGLHLITVVHQEILNFQEDEIPGHGTYILRAAF